MLYYKIIIRVYYGKPLSAVRGNSPEHWQRNEMKIIISVTRTLIRGLCLLNGIYDKNMSLQFLVCRVNAYFSVEINVNEVVLNVYK